MLEKYKDFTFRLLDWWQVNKRDLPWKYTKDPYKIWLSEIILQQTTIRQGLPYYLKFIDKYPTINTLALATDDEVFKMWEGLGYYNRAKNMLFTARYVTGVLNGIFPNNHDDILKLKGIGPYTSAAIASFAFEEAYPVIDGNVLRLISRYLGLNTPIDEKITILGIKSFLHGSISFALPSEFNQALMDFGSQQCTPRNPDCKNCVFTQNCVAFQNHMTESIPFKSKKIVKKKLYFDYFHVDINSTSTVIQQRDSDDIWPNLFQFPKGSMTESFEEKIKEHLTHILSDSDFIIEKITLTSQLKQTLTHRIIYGNFYKISIKTKNTVVQNGYIKVEYCKLKTYAFPKIMNTYIEKYLRIS
jgi:A/G-specific adenine glycosylase